MARFLHVRCTRPMSHETGPVVAHGTVVHAGRRSVTAEGRLVIEATGKLVANATTSGVPL